MISAHATRWSAARAEFRARRRAHLTRKQLARELATYTTAADRNDLLAVLAQHDDADTSLVRDILVRQHLGRAA